MGAFGAASAFPSLQPGDLRHWITFMVQTVTDGQSGKVISWVPSSQGAWTKIEAVRGTDVIRSGQDVTQLFLTVSMWFQDGVKASMHILAPSGAEYVVNSVENVLEMDHILVLNCVALGAQADQGG